MSLTKCCFRVQKIDSVSPQSQMPALIQIFERTVAILPFVSLCTATITSFFSPNLLNTLELVLQQMPSPVAFHMLYSINNQQDRGCKVKTITYQHCFTSLLFLKSTLLLRYIQAPFCGCFLVCMNYFFKLYFTLQ